MCYLKIYDTPIPSNAELYMIEFTKLIEFDILNPESFIKQTIDPTFSIKGLLMGATNDTTVVVSPD